MNVGIIIIGDEILAGRFVDANTSFLARQLLLHGVRVSEVAVLPDIVARVADKLNEFRARFDLVITTGGIGPTHDDITLQAVAVALGTDLVENAELTALARKKIGVLNSATAKLTRVPVGTELLPGGRFVWPPLKVGNVVILPGVPELVQAQFPALVPLLPNDVYVAREVVCLAREVDLAHAAETADRQFPDVAVGSYPLFGTGDHRVLIRFSGPGADRVAEAEKRFLELLPPQIVTTLSSEGE